MIQQSHSKIEALCPIFGQCGGCDYQDISYEEELRLKTDRIQNLVKPLVAGNINMVMPIIGSPQQYYYRHRLDLKIVRNRNQEVFIGFSPAPKKDRKRYPFGLVESRECFIAQKGISQKLAELQKNKETLLPENYRRGNIVIRSGEDGEARYGGIGKKSLHLEEENYFFITINGRKIYYSLDTFFQSNHSILPLLFEYIQESDILKPTTTFYDLYGGVGLFGVGLYDRVGKVVLIEESTTSLQCARFNKSKNRLDNMEIIEGKVENTLHLLKADNEGHYVAMIDPPRSGLSQSAADYISEFKTLDELLYLSCNPEALVRDLHVFVERGWKIKSITPFDFFPRTQHIETLVHLNAQ